MKARHVLAYFSLFLTLMLSACAGTATPRDSTSVSENPPTTTSTSIGTTKPTAPPSPADSSEPSSATETLALRDQIDLQIGGDGLFLSCINDDKTWQEPPAPAVWMNMLFSSTEYPGNVVLCLKGYRADQPITITVSVDSLRYTATVNPVDGAPAFDRNFLYESLPSETLFDNRTFEVYTEESEGRPVDDGPGDRLMSQTWTFLPPQRARDALARSAGFTLTARQADLEATTSHPIQLPTTRDLQVLDRTGSKEERRAVLQGYPVGSDVPIGLYRRESRDSEQARLVKTIATIRMPASRVADVALDERLAGAEEGFYCVAAPIEAAVACNAVEIWPDYPGAVERGDRGRAVRAWQKILIQGDIITDTEANRDGYFGPATAEAIDVFLQDQQIPNPDGPDELARGMYNLITD